MKSVMNKKSNNINLTLSKEHTQFGTLQKAILESNTKFVFETISVDLVILSLIHFIEAFGYMRQVQLSIFKVNSQRLL